MNNRTLFNPLLSKKTILLLLFVLLLGKSFAQEKKYKDPTLPVEERVDDLLGYMTLGQKVGQMCQYVGVEHLKQVEERHLTDGIDTTSDAYGFYKGFSANDMEEYVKKGLVGSFLHVSDWQEANQLQGLAEQSPLGIPLLIATDAIHGHGMYQPGATVFPSPISLASTWDTSLVRQVARATAREMRATGYHWTFSPNVDIARDPRWGRVGETFGEDPYLVSLMGASMVQGYQGTDFSGPGQVIACSKHFLAGSQPLRGLNFGPMDVSRRSLHETWLPPFQAAIEAGAYTVMAAHNEINGMPCHSSKSLLTDMLEKELGFNGFVISDWTDIGRLHSLHKVAGTRKEADFLAVQAGIDMHMHGPEFFYNVIELVKEGKISHETINQVVKKILTAKFQLGLFENPYVNENAIKKHVLSKDHTDLALDAARKSLVLLKNQDTLLPLNKNIQSIFITGPNVSNQALLGDWSLPQPTDNVITVKEGIEQIVSKNTHVSYQAIENIKNIQEKEIERAVAKAQKAEVALVVVGGNSLRHKREEKTSGENAARASLGLYGRQLELVQKVHATGTPTIVVLINGRPLAIDWCAKNIPSIIEAWEPGLYGGLAIAETLFGKNNPSGKLTISFPSGVGQIPCYYNHKPSAYFRSYVDEETKALFPFGHGLSYTTFQYNKFEIPEEIEIGEPLQVSVNLKNTGNYDGSETVIVYVNDKYSSYTTPVKEMKAFKKVFLRKGEEKIIHFILKPEQLSLLDKNMKRQVEPGLFEIMVGDQKEEVEVFIKDK